MLNPVRKILLVMLRELCNRHRKGRILENTQSINLRGL